MQIIEMEADDYDEVMGLLGGASGVVLRAVDSRKATGRFLIANMGLSFIAIEDGILAGCIMGSTDGKRGYLQHLAVHPTFRRQGLGTALVARALEAMAKRGVDKTHVFVMKSNPGAQEFWRRIGWEQREDIVLFSHIASADPNA